MQATLKGLGLRGSIGANGAALSGAASAARHVLPGSKREHAVTPIDSAEVRGYQTQRLPIGLHIEPCSYDVISVVSGHLRLVRGVFRRSWEILAPGSAYCRACDTCDHCIGAVYHPRSTVDVRETSAEHLDDTRHMCAQAGLQASSGAPHTEVRNGDSLLK